MAAQTVDNGWIMVVLTGWDGPICTVWLLSADQFVQIYNLAHCGEKQKYDPLIGLDTSAYVTITLYRSCSMQTYNANWEKKCTSLFLNLAPE